MLLAAAGGARAQYLGKVDEQKQGTHLRENLQQNFGHFAASEFILYQSVTAPEGSIYTALRRFLCQNHSS